MLTPTDSRSRYEDAAVIFFTFINPVTSRMTVNIDNKTYKDNRQEQVTPWEKDDVASQCQRAESFDRRRLQYLCEDGDEEDCETVPKGFSLSVFDSAYQIIKDDIFYNTWLRYVSDRETNSVTTGRSEHNGSPACMHEAWTPSPLQPAEAHMHSPRP
ncbi:putative integral membrane protein [Botryosphaeria dothidea]|uniref:Integral membrane protein n=1 Tax=Botryosphaeria dothidea TaxID=55169 RepID=A0A8H4IGS7_9PEZI|nr:putative integral membrane protein [Botryosphaeria dothidea]